MTAWLQTMRLRARALIRRGHIEDELDRELRFHFDQQVNENVALGMSPEDARLAALRAFGPITHAREACQDAYGVRLLDDLRWDLSYAARTLVKAPGFTVAVVSLALAIGATTAVTSTVDWLLNRSPGGVLDPARLATVQLQERERPEVGAFGLSIPQYEALRRMQDVFVDVAAYGKIPGVVTGDRTSDQVVFEFTSDNYFDVLGVHPILGRVFVPGDDTPGGTPTALLSYDFWQSRFGGDPGVLDRPIRLNGHDGRVVGILPKEFEGYRLDWNGPSSVWLPLQSAITLGRGSIITIPQSFFRIVGRLRPGVNADLARERLQTWLPQLPPLAGLDRMSWKPTALILTSNNEMRIGAPQRDLARTFLGVLLAVSGLVLLAACANIANFLIGRAVRRRHELALRAALGASRSRITRQLVAEAMLLGACAAILGMVVGVGFARLLSPLPASYLLLASRTTPLITPAGVDLRMAAIALSLGVSAALLFGLLPALLTAFRNPLIDLKNPRPHWTWSGLRITTRQVVLVFQVALAVALAVTAGLYARSFARIAAVRSDYAHPENVLIARVTLPAANERGAVFYRDLLTRLNADPQVVSASIGWNPPYMAGNTNYSLPGNSETPIYAGLTAAAPRYFETQGIPVVRGREFTDTPEDQQTVIVNRVLARQLWGTEDPVGRTVQYQKVPRVVVGVVGDDHCGDLLGEPGPCGWQPFVMATTASGYLRIRTRQAPLGFAPALRTLVYELYPDAAVAEETTLADFIGTLTTAEQTAALASSGFALFGIALVAIGCVSLFVSMVKDSVREIAIRMALGATPGRLTRRIVGQGLMLVGVGVGIGLGIAHALAMRVADQLYHTSPTDVVTFVAVPCVITLVGIVTVGYAARVATLTPPADYLRME